MNGTKVLMITHMGDAKDAKAEDEYAKKYGI
jgi:hypothetical protein